MMRKRVAAVFILIGLPFWVGSAWTDDKALDQALAAELAFLSSEQKSTVATKTELPISMAPAPVTVIPLDQIRRSGATTLPELLRLVPGTQVRWNPMMQTLSIRGFGQNPISSRVLLLIDGVPYNSPITGGFLMQPGSDFFSIENVKQIEVIRGPGSSLYGENAFWGVINIVTLSGADLDGGKVKTLINDHKKRDYHVQYGAEKDGKSFLISARYLKEQFPMEFWEKDDAQGIGKELLLKAGVKGLQLTHYRIVDNQEGFKEQLSSGVFGGADHIKQEVEITALKGEHKFSGLPLTLQADLSHSHKKSHHCASCHAFPQSKATNDKVVDHGTQWVADVRAITRALPMQEWMLGVDWRHINTEDHAEEMTTDPRLVTKYQKTAFYAQDRIMLLNDRLNLFLGARYDGATEPELFEAKLSPRLAAVLQFTPTTTLRAGWSRAYRYPSFTEMFQDSWFFNFVRPNGTVNVSSSFAPNFDLKPEKIETFDLGMEHHFTRETRLKLDAYFSTVKDFIVMATPTGKIQFQNHPDTAYVYGAEAELRTRINATVSVFGSLAWQEQRQKGHLRDNGANGGREMEFVYAPEFTISAGLYADITEDLRASTELQWVDGQLTPDRTRSRRIASGNPFDIENSAFLNARLDYTPPLSLMGLGERRPLALNFIVQNLLNEKHEETSATGSLNPDVGRVLMGGFTLRF
ncbi:MAG: TonB-dependent receptor [Magnetococcales bacterium]|nr:TonB-dependent receptor [Magnetococcales bacterium]